MPFANAKRDIMWWRTRSQRGVPFVRRVIYFMDFQCRLYGQRLFADLSVIGSDLPTLLGVTTGIAVLAGLICMVLHLFSKTKYPRTRHFADAHNGPPMMFASDTGTCASLSLVSLEFQPKPVCVFKEFLWQYNRIGRRRGRVSALRARSAPTPAAHPVHYTRREWTCRSRVKVQPALPPYCYTHII